MYAVVVTFTINASQMPAFKEAMLKNAKTSLTEEVGCQQFDVCVDPAHPNEVFLYEVYVDEAAFKAHMASAHFTSFQSKVEGMIQTKDVRLFNEVHQ